MSNQDIFDDIMNQFNSEEEEEIEEMDSNRKSEKINQHRSTASLTHNTNFNIKESF